MNNEITKVSMELALDTLIPMHKSKRFTFPMETQFLGVRLKNSSQLILYYMAPEKNFKKTREEYDFVVLNLDYHSISIPENLNFIATFSCENTTYGVFFRKC